MVGPALDPQAYGLKYDTIKMSCFYIHLCMHFYTLKYLYTVTLTYPFLL